MRLRLLLLAMSALATTVVSAQTINVRSGQTTVAFSNDFVNAAGTLNLNIRTLSNAPFRFQSGVLLASFPITSGVVSVGDLKLEVGHGLGLAIQRGNTRVTLTNFVIENLDGKLKLSGIVTANGNFVAETALFDLALGTTAPAVTANSTNTSGSLRVSNVAVTLTDGAAAALNSVFGVTAFTKGLSIGTATIEGLYDGALPRS